MIDPANFRSACLAFLCEREVCPRKGKSSTFQDLLNCHWKPFGVLGIVSLEDSRASKIKNRRQWSRRKMRLTAYAPSICA